MFRKQLLHIAMVLICCCFQVLFAQPTQKIYLSGKGSDDMVDWAFYCTAGANSGKWSTIGVPSCWELQGFGKYNYGFDKDSVRGKEQGLYRRRFNVPSSYKGKVVNIVFEGVMTDAEVKVNGKSAGSIHQGAFYAFKYDISKLLKYGMENLLEVTVSKHSANPSVNEAERKADFWIFGGIFRPVWLEVLPQEHIEHIAINAKADGSFMADVNIENLLSGKLGVEIVDLTTNHAIKTSQTQSIKAGANIISASVDRPRLWSCEYPSLYEARFTLYDGDKVVHTVAKKFGFRTVEVKQRDGIYVNGVKVKFKGVNRHSFWPTSGRTTSRQMSIDDVLLMKSMNMNAVRMSHYPPDDHFLEACDSLGLYVMDELAGWHGNYDTPTGTKLLKEMIDHDVNHPSIVIWSNGNEGGHNFDLDSLFNDYDIQDRPVVHPWQLFGGIETQHYREYNYGIGNYEYGREILMPTEFLHGWFDGGHGAGLEDYWESMWHNPLSAGGFLWDFADNAVVRHDLNDSLDTDKHRAADGIVGPYHQKEGSYFAIKEIWSPVHFERREIAEGFDGTFPLENRYDFTNLSECSFSWKLTRFELNSLKEETGKATAPDIPPHAQGLVQLNLPNKWNHYDVLYITVNDPYDRELFTWSFTITRPAITTARIVNKDGTAKVETPVADSTLYLVRVKDISLAFSALDGKLLSVKNSKGELPFNNGPVLQDAVNNFKNIRQFREGNNVVIASTFNRKESYNTLKWTIYPSGWVQLDVQYFPDAYFTNFDGVNFSFPEKEIQSVTYMGDGPYRVWKNRMKGTQFGVWKKDYNNTETGEWPWIYPEFKGYYSNFYGGYFYTKNNNRFTVATDTEDLFLRLFTPAWKTDQWHNYEPLFPSGDISFMQGISSLGSKTQRNETTGPMGFKNIFYDYEKDPARALKMTLYFDFSGNELK